jgi:outer membrane protein TolC
LSVLREHATSGRARYTANWADLAGQENRQAARPEVRLIRTISAGRHNWQGLATFALRAGSEEAGEMSRAGGHVRVTRAILVAWAMLLGAVFAPAQDPSAPAALPAPQLVDGARSLPINLPTALRLANVQATDIAAAAARIRIAAAALERARALWLPTITVGGDYSRHDGRIQDIAGNIIDTSRSSLMFGAGTGIGSAAVFSADEALFAPLVARQRLRARQADLQAASNDTLVATTDAYFGVQQARGELAGALVATRRTADIVERTRQLVPSGLAASLEIDRAETELARRRQAELLARERWAVESAELTRILRLDAGAQVDPLEPPELRIDLVDVNRPVDDLIPIALLSRPELASRQAQVQATLALLKQEQLRPLIPSVLLRGFSTPVTGTLAGGIFAGGTNDNVDRTGPRLDLDLQVLWQLDNLGFGNRGRVHEREGERQLAIAELFRTQDRVAAEVAQAYAQARLALGRVELGEKELRAALASADKNLVGLGQTRQAGGVVQTLVRPQEAVAAVQALAQAFNDYYSALADYDRAQFRLYRALGNPAQALADGALPCPASPPVPEPVPPPVAPVRPAAVQWRAARPPG